MTNELEKQFFDAFGIEPKLVESCTKPRHKCSERFVKDCSKCPRAWRKYPQISDRILLELICIDNQENVYKHRPPVDNVEKLKTYILEEFIRLYELGLFKRAQQVRTLFEEG